jgi:two-component system sensor histidine kinase BaeS
MRNRLSITTKLFLAVAGISLSVVVVMGGAVGVGLRRDFVHYAMEVESRRTNLLLEELGDFYADNGGWEALGAEPQRWEQLVSLEEERNDHAGQRADHGRNDDQRGRNGRDDNRDEEHDGGWARRHPDITALGSRLSLLDDAGSVVAGNLAVPEGATRHRILSNGATVGWLAVAPFQGVTDTLDAQFQRRQLLTARLIGGASVLIAGVIAWLLARVFIGRVQRLAGATHALAAGDYGTRVNIKSGDELGKLAEDFNVLARTLEKNDRMRRSFMADVAHELRTPLAVLRAELAAIEDGVRQLTPQTIKSLQAEIGTLSKLIEDLHQLSMSDIGALSYRKSKVDIADLLRTALDAFGERFAEQRIAVSAPTLQDARFTVLGDVHWLTRLFNNLLDNVLRYTDPGGRLEISAEKKDGQVRIEFMDTAPSVPDAALPQLFDRLYRVEPSRSRMHGGAGLGLAICKNIVDAHGGDITARHSPLGGLWVTVTLPLEHT